MQSVTYTILGYIFIITVLSAAVFACARHGSINKTVPEREGIPMGH
jgi:hypothetical protein